MKRIAVLAMALCMVAVMVAPALALDVTFSGEYRARGVYNDNIWLDKNVQESASYIDQRFRLETKFKVSDQIIITTRFDALDNYRFGDAPLYNHSTGNTTLGGGTISGKEYPLDFDRLFLTYKTDCYGQIQIGRTAGGAWGLDYNSHTSDADNIHWSYNMPNGVVGLGWWFINEPSSYIPLVKDNESDELYLYYVYFDPNLTAGLLWAWAPVKNVVNPPVTPNYGDLEINEYAISPYFTYKWGMFSLQGELAYVWGTHDSDLPAASPLIAINPSVFGEGDISQFSYFIEGGINWGPFGGEFGWAYNGGQDPNNFDNTIAYAGYGGVGHDWDKFVIMTDVDKLINTEGTQPVTQTGMRVLYGGASWQALPNLKFSGEIGQFWADKRPANTAGILSDSRDYGTEFDVKAQYKVNQFMTYDVKFGYLNAGDAWKGITFTNGQPTGAALGANNFGFVANTPTEVDNTFTLYHQLTVTF